MGKNNLLEIDGERKIFIDYLSIKTGIFSSCKSVQCSTHGVNLFGDIKSSSLFCPFEEKVFNKMGDPVFMGLFISRPGDDPNSNGHRPEKRDFLCNHSNAVIENGLLIPRSYLNPRL